MMYKSSYCYPKDETTKQIILSLCKANGFDIFEYRGFLSFCFKNKFSLDNFPYSDFKYRLLDIRYPVGLGLKEKKRGEDYYNIAVIGPYSIEVSGYSRNEAQLKQAWKSCTFRAGVELLWTEKDVDEYIDGIKRVLGIELGGETKWHRMS